MPTPKSFKERFTELYLAEMDKVLLGLTEPPKPPPFFPPGLPRAFYCTKKYLVAQHRTGRFVALEETYATTSHSLVDDPKDAKLFPVDESLPLEIHEPAYYFEPSWRAGNLWLVNCRMVCVAINYHSMIVPIPPGPPHQV